MKRLFLIVAALGVILSGCGGSAGDTAAIEHYAAPESMTLPETTAAAVPQTVAGAAEPEWEDAVRITLDGRKFDAEVPEGRDAGFTAVEVEIGQDDGEPVLDKTVLTVDQPGVYVLSGRSDAAQVIVDLGEGAKDDPDEVVTLVLDGLELACAGEPAILFRSVYECGDPEQPGQSVDTTAAGANIYIAGGTENFITCSRLSQSGEDQPEYEAAVWSEMSMNIGGSGTLNVESDNEGLGTGLHLTVNDGNISIVSGNDGINTNYDGASVTTINGGRLNITVSGITGEGDGIDSNGWLVVNGGTVSAAACAVSQDSGIDADLGIALNGGTVIATGNMLDPITGGQQNYAVFRFSRTQSGGSTYTLKNADGKPVLNTTPVNDFTCLILAGEGLSAGEYTLWRGETQLRGAPGQETMMGGMEPPQGMEMPEGRPTEMPEGGQPPRKPEEMPPQGGMTPPEGTIPPEEMEFPGGGPQAFAGEPSQTFPIEKGGNFFANVEDVPQG